MPRIVCPKCNTESYFSLKQYHGPFRCSGCKETFALTIEDEEVKSCQAMTEQDLNRLNIRKHYQ